MLKLVIILFAAVAVQALSTDDDAWQRQLNHVQTMTLKIREISNDLKDSIQKIQADTNQGRRGLLEQTNEFAHNVQDVVYEMQQTAQDTQGEDKKVLQQIAQQLSEIAYSVEQAMNSEPNQMKNQLKDQVEKLAVEAEKLAEHLKQTQKPQKDEDDHMKAMKRIMIDLHATLRKLKTQIENIDKNAQDTYDRLHELATHMRTYVQDVQGDDQQAVQDLVDFVQRLCQKMNNMIDRFERESNDQDSEVKGIMQYAASRLSEIRRDLEKTASTEGNTQTKANFLKEQLDRTILNTAAECQRLLQIVHHSTDQGKITVKNVILDGVAIGEIIQTQLKMLKKN